MPVRSLATVWTVHSRKQLTSVVQQYPVVLALLIIAALGYIADLQNLRLQQQKLRAEVAHDLHHVGVKLESNISGNINLVRGIVSVIQTEPEIGQQRFSELAAGLFDGSTQLRNIAAAPDLVVTVVHPMEGNEKAIGLNYHENKKQRDAAYQVRSTGKIVLAGPLTLVQGGLGLIARFPVYENKEGQSRFWGIVSAVIDAERLYEDSGLMDKGLKIDLVVLGKNGKGWSGGVFFGDETLLKADPVVTKVGVPSGEWVIAAIPKGGWEANITGVWPTRMLILAIATILFVSILIASRLSKQRNKNFKRLLNAKRKLGRQNRALSEAKSRIEVLANQDPLTEIPNRRSLEHHLDSLQCDQQDDRNKFALLLVDLDHFKQVNDRFGHAAGDALLVHVANQLRDLIGVGETVARIGGDEFVVVCDIRSNPHRARMLAEKIVQIPQIPFVYQGVESTFGVSVGVAVYRENCSHCKELLSDADKALYLAKSKGKNRFEVYSEELHIRIERQNKIAEEVRTGLDEGEFLPFYQLQFDAVTNDVIGMEALARWNHKERGLLGPGCFLNAAQDIGVTADLDHHILASVVEDLKHWRNLGVEVPRVSVNVSFQRLQDKRLVEALQKLDIPFGLIAFELHESIFLDELDPIASDNIDKLREMGIRIELDDFGTGHTSILSLLKLKPDCLKIDHQLVIPSVDSDRSRNLVKSIIEIGKSLDIEVIAEGIETMEHATLMQEMGCDALQGYAFARPLPAEEIVSFFARPEKCAV